MYIDIHTHRHPEQTASENIAVVSCNISHELVALPYYTIGIHPWQVADGWETDFAKLEGIVQARPQGLVGIGECGFDKLRGGDINLQRQCFEAQLDLAKRYDLPVVIHCVKAWEELMGTKTGNHHVIIHGFRGKPQLADQLLRRGFELSFGRYFHPESVSLAYKARKMWLETDEDDVTIEDVYEAVSKTLNISPTDIELPGTITF